MSEKPVILIIGGGWHTPASYAKLMNALKDAGYEVHCPAHASVSSERPPVASLKEDTAAVRGYVEDLLQTGKKLLVIAHSYGGQLASDSLHGQSVESRAARGLNGGVAMLIYMCAFALEEGKSMIDQVTEAGHADLIPIAFKFAEDMTVECADPRAQLIGEPIEDDIANEYLSTLKLWNGQCMYDGIEHSTWKELPVAYISTHLDATVPLDYQMTMIERLRSTGKEVKVLDLPNSGHCPNLTATDEIVDFVKTVFA